jgi:hypothetical protein
MGFARSVALVPDVTGDGFDDIAVGAPLRSTFDNVGVVYVFAAGP